MNQISPIKKKKRSGILTFKKIFLAVIVLFSIFMYVIISNGSISVGNLKDYREHNNDKAIKVLFIGIPYDSIYRVDKLLMEISLTQKDQYYHIYTEPVISNYLQTLKMHWESGLALHAIKSKKWDYVVIQGVGGMPLIGAERASFLEYSTKFVKEIKKAGAKVIFYGTWPYKENGMKELRAHLIKINKGRFRDQISNFNSNLHYRAINSLYIKAAKKFESSVVLTAPIRAAIPNGMELYDGDANNNIAGAYVNALAFYKHIFSNKKFDEATYVPILLGNDDAETIIKHVENFGSKNKSSK